MLVRKTHLPPLPQEQRYTPGQPLKTVPGVDIRRTQALSERTAVMLDSDNRFAFLAETPATRETWDVSMSREEMQHLVNFAARMGITPEVHSNDCP